MSTQRAAAVQSSSEICVVREAKKDRQVHIQIRNAYEMNEFIKKKKKTQIGKCATNELKKRKQKPKISAQLQSGLTASFGELLVAPVCR